MKLLSEIKAILSFPHILSDPLKAESNWYMYNPTIKHCLSQSFLYFSFFFWSLPNARYMSFLTCFCFLALMTPILSISFWCLDTLSLILILSDFNLCRYRFCTIFIILLTYNKKFNFKWEMAIVVFHWAFLIQNMLI